MLWISLSSYRPIHCNYVSYNSINNYNVCYLISYRMYYSQKVLLSVEKQTSIFNILNNTKLGGLTNYIRSQISCKITCFIITVNKRQIRFIPPRRLSIYHRNSTISLNFNSLLSIVVRLVLSPIMADPAPFTLRWGIMATGHVAGRICFSPFLLLRN